MKKVIAIFVLVLGFAFIAQAEIPHLISYQGRITDSTGVPLEGPHSLVFRIYTVSAGGSAIWNETHPNVTFEKGVFSVLLGSYVNLDLAFNMQYYLQIQVDGEIFGSRQKISSAAYALRAETADSAISADSAEISNKTLGEKNVFDGNQKVGIGTVTPSADLEVLGTVKMFGAWQQKAPNAVYLAETDGFVLGYAVGTIYDICAYTDAGTNPTTKRAQIENYNPGESNHTHSFIMPVRKSDYWKVKVDSGSVSAIYWLPLGS